jgi:hypothetical protein
MNNTILLLGIILIVVLTGFFIFYSLEPSNTNNSANYNGEYQKVVLSQDDLNYKNVYAQTGKPIAISADSSVGGCLRSVVFNLGGKRYGKYLKTPSDELNLPALEKGTYTFSCSMGMGFGKLIIE